MPAAGHRAEYPLFAYGTLMFGEVVEGLIGRRPPVTVAVLPGWRAARLPGRVYPGLVPAPGGQAVGLLLAGLSAAEWAVFDAFEGDAYLLREAAAVSSPEAPASAGPPATAVLTYAWRDLDDVGADDWEPDWFAAHWLARYAARLRDR